MQLIKTTAVAAAVIAAIHARPAAAQSQTPSETTAATAISPIHWETTGGVDTFMEELGPDEGQHYVMLSLLEPVEPGLSPIIDLLDHVKRIDGTFPAGVLLHVGHGGSDHSIMMENFTHDDDATAMAAAQARLAQYEAAGWDVQGADREIEIAQQEEGRWAIWMFDRAVTNRGSSLDTHHPLVYIAACYGALMGPAYVNKGARVALGPDNCIYASDNSAWVETFSRRLNGREGRDKRPVSEAKDGLSSSTDHGAVTLAMIGNGATTLAPAVSDKQVPCGGISAGATVTLTFDTTCETGITPDIVGAGCVIQNETWLNATTLQGTCTAPVVPTEDYSIRLEWDLLYSDNNAARLDGNQSPLGENGHGPAHDDFVTCRLDFNEDGFIDVVEIVTVILSWGGCAGCEADVNCDAEVDVQDLVEVIVAYGPCPTG